MDNRLDVAQLLEDSDQKAAAVEELAGVSEELTQTIERLQEVENESMCKVADLQKQLQDRTTEIDNLSVCGQYNYSRGCIAGSDVTVQSMLSLKSLLFNRSWLIEVSNDI